VDDSVPLPTVLRAVIYTVEALLESCDQTQAGGVVLVLDLHSLSMSRAQRLHPEVRVVQSGPCVTPSHRSRVHSGPRFHGEPYGMLMESRLVGCVWVGARDGRGT